MGKPFSKALRAKHLPLGVTQSPDIVAPDPPEATAEPQPPPAVQAPSAPTNKQKPWQYEMKIHGRSEWRTKYDAALCLASESDIGLGEQIKDAPDARPRPMTAEERQTLFDLAASFHPR